MKTTIYDVAREAKVSIATVSKVINNTGKIGKLTRENVMEVMKKLDYHPNFAATILTGKKTEILGLLIPDISNPFFSEIARTIEDRAHELGKSVIMCSTDYSKEKETKYLELLQRKQIDGLIATSGFQNKDLLKQLISNNIPVALLAEDDPSLNVSVVSVDDYKGGYIASSYLLANDHRNIAVIGEEVPSSKMRIYGCREAHEEENIILDEENIVKTTASLENGRKCILDLLKRKSPPTAVFALNDLLAIGVIKGAKEKGLRIPEDLSVIGFDNTILATTTVPALTTVMQPMSEMGKKIVDILVEEIDQNIITKERVLFVPKLIVRGTTAKLESPKIV